MSVGLTKIPLFLQAENTVRQAYLCPILQAVQMLQSKYSLKPEVQLQGFYLKTLNINIT